MQLMHQDQLGGKSLVNVLSKDYNAQYGIKANWYISGIIGTSQMEEMDI